MEQNSPTRSEKRTASHWPAFIPDAGLTVEAGADAGSCPNCIFCMAAQGVLAGQGRATGRATGRAW